MKDADGTEYLHFSERQTKTRSGADPRNVRPIKPKAFATPDLPRERDPVVVFKIYSEKRPESMNKPDAPFYLGVNHTTKNSDKSWFKANAMGVNKLNSLMKTMAEKSGLDNSHLTNHSARKRMIQTLNDKDIPPSHIMQLSGHKNVQSINRLCVRCCFPKALHRPSAPFRRTVHCTEFGALVHRVRCTNSQSLER